MVEDVMRHSSIKRVAAAALVCVVFLAPACTSRKKAQQQAMAAYVAGRRAAQVQASSETPPIDLRHQVAVVGNVQNHAIDWRAGLTVATAILTAQYVPETTPAEIRIYHRNRIVRFSGEELLAGRDEPVFTGDKIEIVDGPAAAASAPAPVQ
ncbi:MAG: hypothetical protein JWN25_977 [Verrucomicrobiales bacterium]|nr:hypothetical protein [Verrucomicrobiales bacterium]